MGSEDQIKGSSFISSDKKPSGSQPLGIGVLKTRIENLISSIPLGMVLLSVDLRILSANLFFRELIGHHDTEMRGQFLDKILPSPHLKQSANQVLDTGRSDIDIEYEITQSGCKKHLQLTLVAMKKIEGDQARLLLIIEDITRRKCVEEALRKNKEDLEQTNMMIQGNQAQLIQSEKMASIGQLAAGIAHEINNPVGFVLSNLGTMTHYMENIKRVLEEYKGLAAATQGENQEKPSDVVKRIEQVWESEDISYILEDINNLLKESVEGTERVKDIVQNLRSFSHVDETDIVEADINEGIEATLKIVWNELKYKCQVHKKLNPLPSIRCYPGQLNQVFMNLFINAAQAIPKKGEITIETKATEAHINIHVSDTGTGIREEDLSRLFTPFFTTKPVGKGTGLGLSISYGIVQKHNGAIKVKSQVGKGTTFTVQLPLRGIAEEENGQDGIMREGVLS